MSAAADAYVPRPPVPDACDEEREDAAAIQRAYDALTEVERTALMVSFWRAKAAAAALPGPGGGPLFEDLFSASVAARCVPASAAPAFANLDNDAEKRTARLHWVGVRVAELDEQVAGAVRRLAAAAAEGGAVQVAILGAGLDPRAWRLAWPRPPGGRVCVYEVDRAAVLALKARVMSRFAIPDGCRREAIACDLTDSEALESRLAAAGFDRGIPTVWLLEGLIGYLTQEGGVELLRTAARLSAPGSRVVMTAPPTEGERREFEGRGMKLHHSTFEEVEATLERARRAGWDGTVATAGDLKRKYGVVKAQPVLSLWLPGDEAWAWA